MLDSMRIRETPLLDHEETVIRLHEEFQLSFEAIARQLDVTAARAKALYAEAKTRQQDFDRHGSDSLWLLPSRARGALQFCSLDSRASTRAAIAAGHLTYNKAFAAIQWQGRMLQKVGPKTWAVLCAWAGWQQSQPSS